MKTQSYKYPLLCIICRVLACLNFIVAGVSLFGVFAMFGSAGVGEAFVTLVGSLFGGLLLLGLSQLIEHISSMAFHTRLIWEVVEAGSANLPGSATAIPPVRPLYPVENIVRRRAREGRFFYSIAGAVDGPVDRKELERLQAAGKIDEATFVCADGSNDWQRLDELMAAA